MNTCPIETPTLQALVGNILADGVVRGEDVGTNGATDRHPLHGSAPCLGLLAVEVAGIAHGRPGVSQHKVGRVLGVLVIDNRVPLTRRRVHRVVYIANGQNHCACEVV